MSSVLVDDHQLFFSQSSLVIAVVSGLARNNPLRMWTTVDRKINKPMAKTYGATLATRSKTFGDLHHEVDRESLTAFIPADVDLMSPPVLGLFAAMIPVKFEISHAITAALKLPMFCFNNKRTARGPKTTMANMTTHNPMTWISRPPARAHHSRTRSRQSIPSNPS